MQSWGQSLALAQCLKTQPCCYACCQGMPLDQHNIAVLLKCWTGSVGEEGGRGGGYPFLRTSWQRMQQQQRQQLQQRPAQLRHLPLPLWPFPPLQAVRLWQLRR